MLFLFRFKGEHRKRLLHHTFDKWRAPEQSPELKSLQVMRPTRLTQTRIYYTFFAMFWSLLRGTWKHDF